MYQEQDQIPDFTPTGSDGVNPRVPPDAAMADFDNPSVTHTSQDRDMDELDPGRTIDESEPANINLNLPENTEDESGE